MRGPLLRSWLWIAAFTPGCAPPEDSGAGTSTGFETLGDTGAPTDTGAPSIPCPPIELHQKYELDGDGLYDTVLDSQDDVAILAGCTDISGSLWIDREVTDLTPLVSLRRIVGDLTIHGPGVDPKSGLLTLDGLEGLESVRRVELEYLGVTTLQPFAGLTVLPGGLSIRGLDALESLAGLHNLGAIGGPLALTESAMLADLQALAGITQIPDEVVIDRLPSIQSLEGLHNLEHVGALTIEDCPQIADLDGLRGLYRIDTDLRLDSLEITSLQGLETLTEVGVPGGEPARVLLSLPQLTSLDALAIDWHDANAIALSDSLVTDLDILAGVSELNDLNLNRNDKLVDLAGLESLLIIHDTLRLRENKNLIDIGALAQLQTVGAIMLESSALTDLTLPALQQVGELRITSNAQLVGLSGLSGLGNLGSLVLEFNPALVTLPSLSALTQVMNNLEIRDNDALTSVADLAAVTSVGGRLVVVVNAELLQSEAVVWGEAIAVGEGRKIAGNKGDLAVPPDPCPWEQDGECDQDGPRGLGICAAYTDEWDCNVGG